MKSTLQFIGLGVFFIVGTIKKQVMDFGLRHTRSNPPTSLAYSKSDMFLLIKKIEWWNLEQALNLLQCYELTRQIYLYQIIICYFLSSLQNFQLSCFILFNFFYKLCICFA